MVKYNKQKRYKKVLSIVKEHECNYCTDKYKRHVLRHWLDIINKELSKSRKIKNTKSLSKIFKVLRSEGVYPEGFLIGKGKVQIQDNFYIFQKRD